MNGAERVATGIPGFDDLVEGGFPKGRIILVTGPAGSGKTTFGMQFLYNGVTKHGEKGLFVTLEEEVGDLSGDMARYGWDLDKLAEEKQLGLIHSPIPFEIVSQPVTIDTLLDTLHTKAMEINAQRLVFDSLASLGLPYQDPVVLRRDVLRIGAMLRELGCTTILLTEMPEGSPQLTRYGIEQFVAHGVVVLHVTPSYRAVQVTKMRGTKHDTKIHTMRMTDQGIVVVPGETPF